MPFATGTSLACTMLYFSKQVSPEIKFTGHFLALQSATELLQQSLSNFSGSVVRVFPLIRFNNNKNIVTPFHE